MSFSHWTNRNSIAESKLEQYTHIKNALNIPTTFTSLELCLVDGIPFEKLLSLIAKMSNVRFAIVSISQSVDIRRIKAVFKQFKALATPPRIFAKIDRDDAETILSFLPKSLLISLHTRVDLSSEPMIPFVERLNAAVETKTKLTSLSIELLLPSKKNHDDPVDVLSKNDDKENNNSNNNIDNHIHHHNQHTPVSNFWHVFSPKKLGALTKLTVSFSKIAFLSNKELAEFASSIAALSTIKQLSIEFNQTIIQPKTIEEFYLILFNLSTFQLHAFELGNALDVNQASLTSITRFLHQQKPLQHIATNKFQLCQKLLESFLNFQLTLDHLSSMRYCVEYTKLRNAGISTLASYFIRAKSKLTSIHIALHSKSFSIQSILALGKAINAMENLKHLTIHLFGKFDDDSIKQFAKNVANCRHLEQVSIDLSKPGESAPAQWESDAPGKTIYEQKQIRIVGAKLDNPEATSPIGFYYCYIINLEIAAMNTHATHLELEYPTFRQVRQDIMDCVENGFKNVLVSRKKAVSFKLNNKYSKYDAVALVSTFIKNNIESLKYFEIEGFMYEEFANAFAKQPTNLLRFKLQDIFGYRFEAGQFLRLFPNIIELDFANIGMLGYKLSTFTPREVIASDLTLFFQDPKGEGKINRFGQQLFKECVEARRASLLSIILIEKYILESLTFQPKYITSDLWID